MVSQRRILYIEVSRVYLESNKLLISQIFHLNVQPTGLDVMIEMVHVFVLQQKIKRVTLSNHEGKNLEIDYPG